MGYNELYAHAQPIRLCLIMRSRCRDGVACFGAWMTLPAGAIAGAMAQTASPQAIADYHRKLAEYQAARARMRPRPSAYWSSIAEKRRGRNAKRREHQAGHAR